MEETRIKKDVLKKFCIDVFCYYGLNASDAEICSDVLVSADLRGISSHGVDSLKRYIAGIKEGIIIPKSSPSVVSDRKTTITIDANGGMGMVAGALVMHKLLEKAETYGMGIGTVKESNHFGFGAYYAMKASRNNMLGLVLSNTASIAVPTYASIPVIGSNPISFAVPSSGETDFVLDMATTTVPRGLVKRMADENKVIPKGWAVNSDGEYVIEPQEVLRVLLENSGGLVPLGGKDTQLGGHKGYGMSLMVDILTGTLASFKNSYQIKDTQHAAGRSAQTYVVINISFFRDVNEFKDDVNNLLTAMTKTPAITGKQVVFHGKIEYEKAKYQEQHGILLSHTTYKALQEISREVGIAIDTL